MTVRALLSPADVLEQVEYAVIVVDTSGSLMYANPFAEALFGFPGEAEKLVGRSLVSLVFDEGDARRVTDLLTQVLHGPGLGREPGRRAADGSRRYVRARAMALRPVPGGASGIAILAREVTLRSGQRGGDRIRLLERIGERLSQSLELDVTLRQVARDPGAAVRRSLRDRPVPRRQADRRAQLHARGWMPAPGHLGAGRGADQLPGGALLRAGDVPAGHRRGRGHRTRRKSRRRRRRAWRRAKVWG